MAFSNSGKMKIYLSSNACEPCSQSGFYKDYSTLPLPLWFLPKFQVGQSSDQSSDILKTLSQFQSPTQRVSEISGLAEF